MPYCNIKSHKKPEFAPSLQKTHFSKNHKGGGQINPPVFLGLKQFIRLIANICQYKVDNIILLQNTLCMFPKHKIFMFNVPSLILK